MVRRHECRRQRGVPRRWSNDPGRAERAAGEGRAGGGAQVGGRVRVDHAPSGGGFPFAHVHDEYDEVFYVLEGEIEYRIGEAWTAAPAGSTICIPRGVVHAFRNSGERPARHLVVHAPVAPLGMIEEVGQAEPGQLGVILAKHHTRLADD
jgi:mannose-6-phosphate isomerase-like protein (cupin superfamily)